jgi:hypothetical protein
VFIICYGCAKVPEMFYCADIPCIFLILYEQCMPLQPIQGLTDEGIQEVPKHIEDYMSIVFIFQ